MFSHPHSFIGWHGFGDTGLFHRLIKIPNQNTQLVKLFKMKFPIAMVVACCAFLKHKVVMEGTLDVTLIISNLLMLNHKSTKTCCWLLINNFKSICFFHTPLHYIESAAILYNKTWEVLE